MCTRSLSCGHPCPKKCSDSCEDYCNRQKSPRNLTVAVSSSLQQKLRSATMPQFLTDVYLALASEMNSSTLSSVQELVKKKIDLLEPICEANLSVYDKPKAYASCSNAILQRFDVRLQDSVQFIREFKNCTQQLDDITAEITVVKLMAETIVKASGTPLNEVGRNALNDAFEIIHPKRKLTEHMRNDFKRRVFEAFKCKNKAAQETSCAIM